MSRTIDSRVVEMQFDNKQFESNVKTSMSTLDKLKQSLNLTGASKGLENIGTAAKNVNMSGLSGAVETVRIRFSALEVMAVTALANITNSAINAGKRIVSALTIEPISEGFSEYELKMGSIQTIMAGTGESLETVNKYLDELNVYADRTIYSFADMTSNIGKFTNAGVSLKDSVAAIQGVSNVAAVSGANTNEASRAMYNFAQALSAGYVKLIDWKSIENANMATVEFKNQLLETAVATGTVTKTADGMYKTLKGNVFNATRNFNDVLQDQWMTTEVLVETLGKYADETTDIGKKAFAAAQDIKTLSQLFDTLKEAAGSGWAQTWEILIGDFEEAKKLLTELGGVIGGFIDRTSDARNELLRLWKENGGRETLIEAFRNSFEALGKIIKPISEAFRDIFPPTTSEQLLNLTNGLKTFTERLKIGDETADKIKRTFAGLFAVLDMVKDAFLFVFKVAGKVFGLFGGPTAGGILELTARFGDFLVKLHDTAEAGNIFGRAFEKIQEIFTTVADKIKDAISRIGTAFQGFKSIDTGPLDDFSERSEKSLRPFTRLGEIFGAAFEAIVKVLEWAAPIVAKLGSIIGKGLGALADKVSYAVENMEFNEILDLINTGLFGAILYGIKKFIDSLTEITSGAGGFLEGITGILDGVRGSLEAYQSSLKAKTLLTIATAIGILAAALVVLSIIDSEKLSTSLMAITVLFIELAAAMIVIQKAMGGGKMAKVSIQMVAMATAILILSAAMKNLAALDWEGLAKGTVGIAALAAVLVVAAHSLDKSSGRLIKGSTGLIAFSAAILIMSKSVESMSALSWEELAKGLTGLTVILAEVVAITHLMGDSKSMISTGIGMIALGAAMLMFAEAVERMGQLSWEEIGKGLVTMAGALTAVTIAMNLLPKGMINKATGMTVMGTALLIIGEAVGKMGSLNWGEIARGLTTLAGALAAITLALNFMPQGMITKATGLIGVAAALTILVKPLREMGSMSWEEIAKGLATLAGSMTILAVALNVMQKAIPGAAAMMIVAPALAIMAGVLGTLGRMPLSEIGTGLLALAGVFVVLGAAALILQPLVPTIIGLGAAIALLGVGVAAVGVGVLAFATGLTALSVSATAAAGAIVVIGSAILSLIPIFFKKIGEGIVAFAGMISNGLPVIMDAVRQIGVGLVQVLVEITPDVVSALLTFLNTMLDQLAIAVPDMVDSGMRLLLGILEGVTAHIQDVVVIALTIISEFLTGLAEGLPSVISAGVDIIVALLDTIAKETPRLIDAGFKMIIDFVNGLADAVRQNTPLLVDAFINLAEAVIEGLVSGLLGGVTSAVNAIKKVGNAIVDGFKNLLGIHSPSKVFEEFGEDTVDGYSNGVNNNKKEAEKAAKKLADAVINTSYKKFEIKNKKSQIFKELGVANAEGFISGLTSMGDSIKQSMTKAFSGNENEIKIKFSTDKDGYEKALSENKTLISNMHSIVDEALKTIGQRLDSYTELATDRMSRISTKSEVTVSDMITNLKHNQMAIAKWADGIASLTERGLNEGLIEELRAAGPKSAGEVKALVAASDKELQTLNAVMSRGGKVATNALVTSVGQGAPLLVEPGQKLVDAMAQGLASSTSTNQAMGLLIDNMKREALLKLDTSTFTELGKNVPQGLAQGISGTTEGAVTAVTAMADATKTATKDAFGIHSPSIVYAEYGKNLLLGLAEGIKTNTNAPIDALNLGFTEMNKLAETAGVDVMSAFVRGVNVKQPDLTASFTAIAQAILSVINNKSQEFNMCGQLLMSNFITGIKMEDPALSITIANIISECLTVINNKYHEFESTGQSLMVHFIAGIKAKDSAVSSTFTQIISGALTEIKNKYNDFYNAGKYLVEGFAEGIADNIELARDSAKEMARAASRAASRELDEHSPSKVGYRIGEFFGIGFVNAISDYAAKSYKAGTEIANSAKNGLSNAISNIADIIKNGIDTQPTIRPVLDLSDVETGTSRLNTLFSRTQAMSISAGMNRTASEEIQNGGNVSGIGNTYSFTQNNYSPKPLSRLEIYRQTKNQFSAMKGLVEA